METATRRASCLHPPAADGEADADEASVRADIRQLRRQEGFLTHNEQDDALYYTKTVNDNDVFLEAMRLTRSKILRPACAQLTLAER